MAVLLFELAVIVALFVALVTIVVLLRQIRDEVIRIRTMGLAVTKPADGRVRFPQGL
jgi:hypothetical protein